MWDIGFFLMIILVYISTFFTRTLISFSDEYPSVDFALISLIIFILISLFGLVYIQGFISKKVHPAFRKKIFPALCYYKHLDNPFLAKNPSKIRK